MLEFLGMWSTSLLPSLPCPLWPGMVAPDKVLSMSQIELNSVLMLKWIVWNRTVLTFKLCTYVKLFEIKLFICIKMDLASNNLQCLLYHKTKPNQTLSSFTPDWVRSALYVFFSENTLCPVGWGCRIHRLLLCRGVRPPPTSVLDMTLNNLMVRFQQCWSFGECGVPLHCHRSLVHSGLEW